MRLKKQLISILCAILMIFCSFSFIGCGVTDEDGDNNEVIQDDGNKKPDNTQTPGQEQEPEDEPVDTTPPEIENTDGTIDETESGNFIVGTGNYVVQSIEEGGRDSMGNYAFNYLSVFDDTNIRFSSASLDGVETIDSTYTKTGKDTIVVKSGRRTNYYTYDAVNKTISCDGTINGLKTKAVYKQTANYTIDQNSKGSVTFGKKGQQLFSDEGDRFNYCPSIILEGKTMHVYYCANLNSGDVMDCVAYRKGELKNDGKWTFSAKQYVLYPERGPGMSNDQSRFDWQHACDPEVIKGDFSWNGQKYSYLMAYLGNRKSGSSCENSIGLAVAKNPAGPWTKVKNSSGELSNGLINFYSPNNGVTTNGGVSGSSGEQWGFGQPSLINISKAGKVLLFYTCGVGNTSEKVEYWDFSNLNNPQRIATNNVTTSTLSTLGLKNERTDKDPQDFINNGDFTYDEVKKKLYCVFDEAVNINLPTHIADSSQVAGFTMTQDDLTNGGFIGKTLFVNRSYQWSLVGRINSKLSGYQKNHNCGVVTDPYGFNLWSDKIPVVYTVSDTKTDLWGHLRTYRLHGAILTV